MIKVKHKVNNNTVQVFLTESDAQHLWNACINYRAGFKQRDWAYNLADVYDWVMARTNQNELFSQEYQNHGQGD